MNITPSFPILLTLGFLIGAPASMVGLGGGFLIVPLLILIFQLPAQNAVAISLMAMSGTTISAAISYWKQRRIDYKLALLYDVLDVPGVVIGAYLTKFFPSNLLTGLCGLFIMSISLLMARNKQMGIIAHMDTMKNVEKNVGWKRKIKDSSGKEFRYVIRRPVFALVSSLLGGLITGLSGLGGGITDTTTMVLLGVPPHVAVASSEFAMALTNGAGVVAHGFLENILFEHAVPLTIGTIIGAQVGSSFSRHVKAGVLRRILSLIAFLLGLRLILFVLGV
jgi:hypothetical protein